MLKDSRFGLLLALLFAGSMWFYVQEVLIPRQKADAAAHGRPRGNLSDLYPRWVGARELLLHGRDPYSEEVTREIQRGYYGRELDPSRADDPKDQQGFAYPVYVSFLLAPTVGLSFPAVQIGFRWLLVILTLMSIPWWLQVVHWRPSAAGFTALVLLTFGSFPVVQGIKLQQLTLLVGGLLAASGAALVEGNLVVAGFLLALATIKPQLALPMAGWLVLWAASDWKQRKRFVWSLAATMVALLAASEYALPGWVGRFRNAVTAYREYTGGAGSLLDVLATPVLGRILAAAAVIAVAVLGWGVRREGQESKEFGAMLALVLTVTIVIVPSFAPYNQVLLLPAIFLIVASWSSLWRRNRLIRAACCAGALVVIWPWLASFGLAAARLFWPATYVEQAWAAPLYTSLAIPLAVLGLLSLSVGELLKIRRDDSGRRLASPGVAPSPPS